VALNACLAAHLGTIKNIKHESKNNFSELDAQSLHPCVYKYRIHQILGGYANIWLVLCILNPFYICRPERLDERH
jgi:hypothetical protein